MLFWLIVLSATPFSHPCTYHKRIIIHIRWQRPFKDRPPMFERCLYIRLHVQTSAGDLANIWMPMFEWNVFKHRHSNIGCQRLNANVPMLPFHTSAFKRRHDQLSKFCSWELPRVAELSLCVSLLSCQRIDTIICSHTHPLIHEISLLLLFFTCSF